MIGDRGRTCVSRGDSFEPSHPYRGAYCPDCQTTADGHPNERSTFALAPEAGI